MKVGPLLQGDDLAEKLDALLAARGDLYAQAALHVENNGDDRVVVQEITQKLAAYL